MVTHVFKHPNDPIDSIFTYTDNFLNDEEQNDLIDYFDSMEDFHPCHNYRGDPQRYQKWYQKDGKYFCSAWKHRYPRWVSFQYTDVIQHLQDKIQTKINAMKFQTSPGDVTINSCLINKYTGSDNYIGPHRDSPEAFGEYPMIVGISLGAERVIKFEKVIYNDNKPKSIKIDKVNPKSFSFTLKSGSIFTMSGSSQKHYVHSIPKEDNSNKTDVYDDEGKYTNRKSGLRYSITFREFL
jgi:alkylated DNA repair dioxygenase AlkB